MFFTQGQKWHSHPGDPRLFGPYYHTTEQFDTRELAEVIRDAIAVVPGWDCGVALHREGCVEITVTGAVDETSSPEYLDEVVDTLGKWLSCFGWVNPEDSEDRRIRFCALALVEPKVAHLTPHVGHVIVTPLPCPHRN